jgi:hypothetical protein
MSDTTKFDRDGICHDGIDTTGGISKGTTDC